MAITPPPDLDLKADQGPRLVASMIALIVLPTLCVIARLISRRVSHAGYWYDDLLVSMACALCYIQCICVLISERYNGFGRHIYVLPDPKDNTREFLKILYIYQIGYVTATTSVKLAILFFYRRIFPVPEFRLPLFIALAVVLSYFVGAITTAVFQCTPIHVYWDRMQPGHCINADKVLIVSGSINCVLDFLIINLPIPLLWRLRTTVSQKGILTGIFACAGFVTFISIIRLVVLSRLGEVDVTWNYVNSAIWSAAEPSMGVVSACIPSLRPGVSALLRGTTDALGVSKTGKASAANTSSSSSRMLVSRTRENDGEGNSQPFDSPIDGNRGQLGHDFSVRGGQAMGGKGTEDEVSLEALNVPAGGIRVKKEVVVTSTDWLEYRDRVF